MPMSNPGQGHVSRVVAHPACHLEARRATELPEDFPLHDRRGRSRVPSESHVFTLHAHQRYHDTADETDDEWRSRTKTCDPRYGPHGFRPLPVWLVVSRMPAAPSTRKLANHAQRGLAQQLER
jgi:hypothetical protein